MVQQLNLARAAQLVGLPRSTLQRMIGEGRLASIDGFIAVDELRRAFPQTALEDAGAFEKVARIRAESFGKRVRERLLPSQEVLAQRLFAHGQEMADLRRYLSAYHALAVDSERRLRSLAAARDDNELRVLADEMQQGLGRVLGTEPAEALDAMANVLNVISAQVTVRPSGRQFLLEGNDSILQAGLKAGLRFSYGCGTGACGLCKARVVSGELRQVQHADYALSEMERQQGYALLCTHTAVTDVVVETLEARGPADIPDQSLTATVREVAALGPDVRLLHLQTPRSNRLRFLAGQSVTLGLATAQGDVAQTLPLASCPCDERNLHFHVARDAAPLADLLFAERIRRGDAVSVRGPVGDFVLASDSDRPLLLVACDSGFGPIKSLIEHAIASEQVESFSLDWLATAADGHYLANQCRAWAAAFDQFRYAPLVEADVEAGARRIVEAIKARHGAIGQCDVFVAGPAAFVEPTMHGLLAAGARPELARSLVV
jgi:CDP-4-dehydro-6-deoxyglucose reductase, E3